MAWAGLELRRLVICDAVVASRAPFLEAWRIRRLYKEVLCRLLSILGLTLLRNCLEGLVKACVYPRSSSDRDWRGGLVEECKVLYAYIPNMYGY